MGKWRVGCEDRIQRRMVEMNKRKIAFVVVLIFVTLMIALRGFAEPYRISGDCMEPAIKDGQLHFLNRGLPYLRRVQMGDIVLFKYDEKVWVSRIVALEGNVIQINDGNVIVNGTPL